MGVTTSVLLESVKQIRSSKDWKTPKPNRRAIPSVYKCTNSVYVGAWVIRCPSPRFLFSIWKPIFAGKIERNMILVLKDTKSSL